mmetsp:Transcript_35606/g.79128  ORF Transcript_35606/g.79128 Transcript_35606/m.79128 type:complete len:211 (-) Transcript_35606:1046-1678(-)
MVGRYTRYRLPLPLPCLLAIRLDCCCPQPLGSQPRGRCCPPPFLSVGSPLLIEPHRTDCQELGRPGGHMHWWRLWLQSPGPWVLTQPCSPKAGVCRLVVVMSRWVLPARAAPAPLPCVVLRHRGHPSLCPPWHDPCRRTCSCSGGSQGPPPRCPARTAWQRTAPRCTLRGSGWASCTSWQQPPGLTPHTPLSPSPPPSRSAPWTTSLTPA